MAVQPQTPYIEHIANGTTTNFNLGFDCDDQDHLIVLVDDIEPVVGTWSLSNGAVVFGTTPTTGKKITIQRNTPFRRDGDFQSYDNSFRPGPVNKDFDWIWLKLQELGVADWILGARIDALKNYVDRKDDELKAYLMEEIRKQGVSLDQLDEYYNYLMQRLAQIAVDKGWDASFIVDGDKNQKQINAQVDAKLASLKEATPVPVDDYWIDGMANWGVALQAAIDAANNAGGGRVFMPARIYDTSETIVMKSNVILEGEFRGERGSLGGSVIRKNGNYVGLRFGLGTTVRCDDFGAYNFSVDGNNYDGDGVSFEHCHYFDIDNLASVRNTNGGRGFHFFHTWTGTIGQLFSVFNDINYRMFFQCNALEIGHLYSSTADGGATKVHLQIGGLLGVNINLLTTEGTGRYHIQQLGYTNNLKIGSWYCEFNQTTAGLLNVLYSNATDDAQKNIATSIDNIMIIGNGISTAFPIVNISNSHRGYVFKNSYIRLNGTADYSSTMVMRVNNSNSNTDAQNVGFDQIHIEDNTTGNATTTYGVFFQGAKSSNGKATNITTTKANLVNKWAGFDYDQKTNGRSFAYLTPISLVAPRYVGEMFTATTKSRLYTANGLGLGDWARVDGAVELVDEPLFAAQGAWTLGAGWSISGGDLVLSGTGLTSQQLDIKAGKYYRVRFAVKGFTSGDVSVAVGGVSVSTVTANATFDQIIRATNFNQLSLNASVASNLKFDYFSVTESGAI